jgi:hypothetical protein
LDGLDKPASESPQRGEAPIKLGSDFQLARLAFGLELVPDIFLRNGIEGTFGTASEYSTVSFEHYLFYRPGGGNPLPVQGIFADAGISWGLGSDGRWCIADGAVACFLHPLDRLVIAPSLSASSGFGHLPVNRRLVLSVDPSYSMLSDFLALPSGWPRDAEMGDWRVLGMLQGRIDIESLFSMSMNRTSESGEIIGQDVYGMNLSGILEAGYGMVGNWPLGDITGGLLLGLGMVADMRINDASKGYLSLKLYTRPDRIWDINSWAIGCSFSLDPLDQKPWY